MARAASIFRWAISVVGTLFLLPLVSRIWGGVLDRGDVANHPVDWIVTVLAAVTQAPGFFPALFVTIGLVAGVWSDWLLRKLDGSRASIAEHWESGFVIWLPPFRIGIVVGTRNGRQ